MTKTEKSIVRLIRKAKKPITAATMGNKVGLGSAFVRTQIHDLRIKGNPIGSLSSRGGGFFWATKAQQLDHTVAHFRSRINSMRTAMAGVMVARRRLNG